MQSECSKELRVARVITNQQSKSFQDNTMPGDQRRAAHRERNLRSRIELSVPRLTQIENESGGQSYSAYLARIFPACFREPAPAFWRATAAGGVPRKQQRQRARR